MNSRLVDELLDWRTLCRAAVLEQDPDKLLQIVQRINAALISRQQMLRGSEETGRGSQRSRLERREDLLESRSQPSRDSTSSQSAILSPSRFGVLENLPGRQERAQDTTGVLAPCAEGRSRNTRPENLRPRVRASDGLRMNWSQSRAGKPEH